MFLRLRIAEVSLQYKGWSMKELSEQLSLDHQTVLYWNQGRSLPRLPTLIKICRLLGCRLDELVDLAHP